MSEFEDNLKINTVTVGILEKILKEHCRDDVILSPIFLAAKRFLKWGEKPYLTRVVSKKYVSFLKEFDMMLIGSDYTPSWQYYEQEEGILDFDPKRVTETFEALKMTGELFYFYVMVIIYLGGSTDEGVARNFEEHLKDILNDFKVYVTAKKMEREFSMQDVKKAANYTYLAEPVDISTFPAYLTDSKTSIIRQGGRYYLTADILKALTAAGGVAQSLERQDLEGGVTNAAHKQGPTRPVHANSTDDDSEDAEDSKTSS